MFASVHTLFSFGLSRILPRNWFGPTYFCTPLCLLPWAQCSAIYLFTQVFLLASMMSATLFFFFELFSTVPSVPSTSFQRVPTPSLAAFATIGPAELQFYLCLFCRLSGRPCPKTSTPRVPLLRFFFSLQVPPPVPMTTTSFFLQLPPPQRRAPDFPPPLFPSVPLFLRT